MAINEFQARRVLQKSGLPDIAYVINPYTGCVHGCVYCYARFMKRFTGHTEPWGSFLDAKVNAPDVLKRQLERRREPLKDLVFLSSVTDPYLSAEKKYRLTRGILEVLLEHQVPISLLTKSDLVLRDLDLLRQFENCSVGLSLMTIDDELAHQFEPRAPSPTHRLQALRKLKENGIETYAFISPYLPHLSDIEHLIKSLHGSIHEIGVEALNVRGGNWSGIEQILTQFYPKLLFGYKQLARDDSYWSVLEEHTRHLAAQFSIRFMGFYRH
jgi:DNA repair photolyase